MNDYTLKSADFLHNIGMLHASRYVLHRPSMMLDDFLYLVKAKYIQPFSYNNRSSWFLCTEEGVNFINAYKKFLDL